MMKHKIHRHEQYIRNVEIVENVINGSTYLRESMRNRMSSERVRQIVFETLGRVAYSRCLQPVEQPPCNIISIIQIRQHKDYWLDRLAMYKSFRENTEK